MTNAVQKAKILSQALPYIQKYHGKIIVIKYGGNAMLSEELKNDVIEDIVLLTAIGIKVVMVHGGGPEINEMLRKVGIVSRFVDGLRYTDIDTMNIVQMILAGQINKNLVSMISTIGGKAVGISGMDAGLIQVRKRDGDFGYVGDIVEIKEGVILDLLNTGYIPVVAGLGEDGQGQSYNINADTVAAAIAAKLNAENMVLISNVPGVLRDPADEKSLIPVMKLSEVKDLIEDKVLTGGMLPKIECLCDCVKSGVKKAVLIDGRIPHSLLIEILSDEGIGTMVING